MSVESTILDLEQYDLTPDQAAKLAEIKRLAAENGYINPGAQPNVRRESLVQGQATAKTFADQASDFIAHDIPDIGAATAGGMAAASRVGALPLPGILKPLAMGAAGIAGATSGLLTTRGARTILDQGKPLSLDQLFDETRRSGIEAVSGEVLGAGARLLGHGYGAGKRMLLAGRPATTEELQTVESAKGMGVHLRPADVTKSPAALRTEQTLRSTQAGADIFKKRDLLNQENFSRAYHDELDDVVASRIDPQERGTMLKDLIENRAIPEYQEMARRQYDQIRQVTNGQKLVYPKESFELAKELAGSVTAETNPKAHGLIKKVMEQIGQPGPPTGLTVTGLPMPGKKLENVLEVDIKSRRPDRPRPLDFMEAHELRSMLGEVGATGETLPKKAQGIANRLWQVLGLEMEQGALKFRQQTGIPVDRLARQADDFVKVEGHALFDDNVIARMLKANPEDVVRETLKPNGLTEVQRVTDALSRIKDEPGLNQYRRGVLEELWSRGVVKTGVNRGQFSGTQFADEATKLGEPTLKAALGPHYGLFKKFYEVAADMDPKAATGIGMSLLDKGVLISAPLAGVGGSIMQQSAYPLVGAVGAVGSWLISTKHIAKMLNDPKKAGELLRVAKTTPGTEAWTRAVGQLLTQETGERVFPRELNAGTLQPAP